MRCAAALALVLAASVAFAQAPEPSAAPAPQPVGEPVAGEPVRDREFGVVTRWFGLQRQVEMFQWRRTPLGYVREWSAGVIDSGESDPVHRNPDEMPLATRVWWAEDVTLDGHPIDIEVLRTLGEWRAFRPGFSRLPANLAATFQPDGDGLSSAENPLQPEIGDLRITWRELHLPPLAGRVMLREGVWRLDPDATVYSPPIEPPVQEPDAFVETQGHDRSYWIPLAALAAVVIVLVAIAARRRRRHSK